MRNFVVFSLLVLHFIILLWWLRKTILKTSHCYLTYYSFEYHGFCCILCGWFNKYIYLINLIVLNLFLQLLAFLIMQSLFIIKKPTCRWMHAGFLIYIMYSRLILETIPLFPERITPIGKRPSNSGRRCRCNSLYHFYHNPSWCAARLRGSTLF